MISDKIYNKIENNSIKNYSYLPHKDTLADSFVTIDSKIKDFEDKYKYKGSHYTDFGFGSPLHAFFNPAKKGAAIWIKSNGECTYVTVVRAGEYITPEPGETYVGDVIACVKPFVKFSQ